MSGEHSQNTSIHLMRETGGFGVIPDDTGAAGLFLPARRGGYPQSEKQVIRLLYASGRNKQAKGKPGKDGGALPVTCDLYGFSTSELTPGQSPPAEDALDLVLRSLMGDPTESDADTVTAGAASTFTAAGAYTDGQMVAVRGAGTNNGYAQWGRVEAAGAGVYNVDPAWIDPPSNGDIAAACRTWIPVLDGGANVHTDNNGDSFTTIVDLDGVHYFLPGCRPGSLAFTQKAGDPAQVEFQLRADRFLRQQAAALPAVDLSNVDCAVGLLTPLDVNGTLYDVMQSRFDLGVQVSEVAASGQLNGRSNFKVTGFDPVLTFDPLNATVWEDLYNAQTEFSVTLQYGMGALANGRLNTLVVHMEHAQVTAYPGLIDDEGKLRRNVEIRPHDGGVIGIDGPLFQIGRC